MKTLSPCILATEQVEEEFDSIFRIDHDGAKVWENFRRERHRSLGPAYESADGSFKSYWNRGKRHRFDGPAIENSDGHKSYCINGQLHRIDGPAVIYPNGIEQYYLRGKRYTKEEFLSLSFAELMK